MNPHGKNFPDVVIPVLFLDAMGAGRLFDRSWQNDESPSFALKTDATVRVFVNHEQADQRPFDCYHRFLVVDDDQIVFYMGDDANNALKALTLADEIKTKSYDMAENGLNAAVGSIQKEMGIDSGDFAAQYFSGDVIWVSLVEKLRDYAVAERVFQLRAELEGSPDSA